MSLGFQFSLIRNKRVLITIICLCSVGVKYIQEFLLILSSGAVLVGAVEALTGEALRFDQGIGRKF